MPSKDLECDLSRFPAPIGLFPLPNLVLLPCALQTLHIFEPRYRQLVEDALAGYKQLAIAQLAPGWERDYEGRPRILPVVCVAHIIESARLDDGRFNLIVVGVSRAKILRELPPRRLYREAEVELLEDVYPESGNVRYDELMQRLYSAVREVLADPYQAMLIDRLCEGSLPLGMLTDVLTWLLELDLASQTRLLTEANVERRAELLLNHLASLTATQRPHDKLKRLAIFPPEFSAN